MPISENMVQEIVQEVMAKMQIADAPAGKHGVFKDMNDAIEAAKKAQLVVKTMSMDQREKIITCIRKKIKENAEVLARMGVEETGMGNVGDKILKHHLVADKTPGTEDITTTAWSGDRGLTLIEMGPFGVIGAITPCTNPSDTVLCNTMGMLAGGNTVVFNPHPAAVKTSIYAINLLNEASLESGGPDNIAVTVEKPTLETSNIMMKHKDIHLIAATGGPGVVTAVLSSGKRGIGAVAWFAVCLFGISFLFFNGIPPIKKTAPCRGSPQPRAVHNHPVSWYQWLHLHGTGEPSHNHKAAPLHPPYISHSHVYADHISHPEWGVLHAPEALPSGYPKGVLHRGSKVPFQTAGNSQNSFHPFPWSAHRYWYPVFLSPIVPRHIYAPLFHSRPGIKIHRNSR